MTVFFYKMVYVILMAYNVLTEIKTYSIIFY